MKYKNLGNTDLKVSEIGLGAMIFGWKSNLKTAKAIVDLSAERGVNFIDTSNSYGQGNSEIVLGKILKLSTQHSNFIVATKFRIKVEDEYSSHPYDIKNIITQQCEDSLVRLQTDHIDLYQIHFPNPEIPFDEILSALDLLKRDGKIRYAGSCNFDADQCRAAADVSERMGAHPFITEQLPYNLLDRHVELELFPAARELGLGIIARSSLAEGMLTGKYKKDQPIPPNSRYAKVDKPEIYTARLTDMVFEKLIQLQELASQRQVTMSALSIAWCRNSNFVDTTLIGPSNVDQAVDNLNSCAIDLNHKDVSTIDELVKPGSIISSFKARLP